MGFLQLSQSPINFTHMLIEIILMRNHITLILMYHTAHIYLEHSGVELTFTYFDE